MNSFPVVFYDDKNSEVIGQAVPCSSIPKKGEQLIWKNEFYLISEIIWDYQEIGLIVRVSVIKE